MKKTNSTERKKRLSESKIIEFVMDYITHKKTIKTIASELNVSEQTVRNWVKKYQNSKQAEPSPLIENITDYVYANNIPIPLIYTLEEAASVAKISINQLLHYAALGKIILFIDRPIDSVVLSIGQVELTCSHYSRFSRVSQQDNLLKKVTKWLTDSYKVPFLAISCSDCKYLEMGLSITKNEFHSVFYLQNEELIRSVDNKGKREVYYVFSENLIINDELIDVNKDRFSIHVSKKILKVSSKELEELISSEIKRKANRQPCQEQFVVHENKSTFLVELDQAAFELWGDFNPIKAVVFNTSDKVGEYLADSFQFCAANAHPLAVIITPSANNPILPTEVDAKEITYRPQLLSGVLLAWSAVCMSKKFEKVDSPIRYEEVARKWLTDNWPELTKYEKTISNVVKLITPDNAPFDKLRKSKK